MLEHHAKKNPEENRYQESTMPHALCVGKGIRQVNIEPGLSCWFSFSSITICANIWEQPRRFMTSHIPVLYIKSYDIESSRNATLSPCHVLGICLWLTEGDLHVRCASVGSEATQSLSVFFYGDGSYKPLDYSGMYVSSD